MLIPVLALALASPSALTPVSLRCEYLTDPIGGPVAAKLSEKAGRRVDEDLLDPAQCWYLYGQAPPAPTGHSGYWADQRVWEVVNCVAATPSQASLEMAARD